MYKKRNIIDFSSAIFGRKILIFRDFLINVCAKLAFLYVGFFDFFTAKIFLEILIYVAYVIFSFERKLVIMPVMGVLQLKRLYGYTEFRHLEEGD